MPETPGTLDKLIGRIQKEGIEKAEAESAERIASAEKKAAGIVDAAENKAADILARAEEQGKEFEKRGRQSLTQAARDTLLSVSQAIDALFQELTRQAVKQSLEPDTLRSVIADVINRYFSDPEAQRDVNVLVTKDDAAAIGKQLMAEFGDASKKGITLGEDNELTGGFKISRKDEHLYHDLSVEAIARILCEFLRPQLADITRDALKTMQQKKQDSAR